MPHWVLILGLLFIGLLFIGISVLSVGGFGGKGSRRGKKYSTSRHQLSEQQNEE